MTERKRKILWKRSRAQDRSGYREAKRRVDEILHTIDTGNYTVDPQVERTLLDLATGQGIVFKSIKKEEGKKKKKK